MSIVLSNKGGGSFEPTPEGNYKAICYKMVDMGSHENSYGNLQRKIRLSFQLFEGMDDEENPVKPLMIEGEEKPYQQSEMFTASLNDRASLRKFLEQWREKPFSEEEAENFVLDKLLGAAASIKIVHAKSKDGKKTYTNVFKIGRLAKKDTPKSEETPIIFDFEENFKSFDSLSEWEQSKIKESPEFQDAVMQDNDAPPEAPAVGEDSDEIPF